MLKLNVTRLVYKQLLDLVRLQTKICLKRYPRICCSVLQLISRKRRGLPVGTLVRFAQTKPQHVVNNALQTAWLQLKRITDALKVNEITRPHAKMAMK